MALAAVALVGALTRREPARAQSAAALAVESRAQTVSRFRALARELRATPARGLYALRDDGHGRIDTQL
jgi:hypothetical protein